MVLISNSGGLRYHLSALRSRKSPEWAVHAENVDKLLRGFLSVPPKRLILVGPSAGYSLPSALLGGCSELLVIEPDPVARFLFRRRFPRQNISWIRRIEDLSTARGLDYWEGVPAIFCNVLGQLHFEDHQSVAGLRAGISYLLTGRPWCSYHDRVSGDVTPTNEVARTSAQRLSDTALLAEFYSAYKRGSDTGSKELIEHPSLDWISEAALARATGWTYWIWPLRPGQFHVVEACFSQNGT